MLLALAALALLARSHRCSHANCGSVVVLLVAMGDSRPFGVLQKVRLYGYNRVA